MTLHYTLAIMNSSSYYKNQWAEFNDCGVRGPKLALYKNHWQDKNYLIHTP